MSPLEHTLTSLASQVEFPPTPDLTGKVVAAIGRPAPASKRVRLWPALAAAAFVLFAAVMVVAPGARRAVADFLGIGGVRITFEDAPHDPDAPGSGLGLGDRVTLVEAEARTDFTLRLPAPAVLGPPDATYLAEAEGFSHVAFAYDPEEGLPAAPGHQEGLLFTQFRGRPEESYLKKLAFAESRIDEVRVRDTLGLWVEGPHQLDYEGPNGTFQTDSTRLSASSLIWEEDGVTYRLESDLPKQRALELAEALE